MDELMRLLETDPEFKKDFLAHMHNAEARMNESFKIVYENLNKEVMASIKAFAAEKGMTLTDSEVVKSKVMEQCRAIADQMNKAIKEQFAAKF